MKVIDLLESSNRPKYPGQPFGELGIKPWAEEHAKKFMSNPCWVFRGSDDKHEVMLLDTNDIQRISRNTYNFYTQWMDNHPQWAAYPKRSKSLVCSTSEETASGYNSELRAIIPDDNCKVGVCPKADLWWSFKAVSAFFRRVGVRSGESMDNANDKLALAFGEILNIVVVHPHESSPMDVELGGHKSLDWPALKSALEEFTPDLLRDTVREKTDTWSQERLRVYVNIAKRMEREGYDSLYELLTVIMSPEKNGFSLITPDHIHTVDNDREIWIGGGKVISANVRLTPEIRDIVKTPPREGGSGRQQDQGWEAFH